MMENQMKECLSCNIRMLRQYKKMSQNELAKRIGVTAGYIGFLETGVRTPSLEIIRKIAEILEIPPYRLFQTERDLFPSADSDGWCTIRALLEEITVRTEKLHDILDILQKPPSMKP